MKARIVMVLCAVICTAGLTASALAYVAYGFVFSIGTDVTLAGGLAGAIYTLRRRST